MKKLVIIFLSISILLSACQKQTEDKAAPEQNKLTLEKAFSQLRAAAMLQSRPTIIDQNIEKEKKKAIKWDSDLTAQIVGGQPIPDYCGSGTSGFVVKGKGNALHFGKITTKASACFPTSPFQVGTITTSEGDKILFQQVSFGPDVPLQTWGYIFTGGTGRFKNASGSFDLVYSVYDFANNVFISKSTGTITY